MVVDKALPGVDKGLKVGLQLEIHSTKRPISKCNSSTKKYYKALAEGKKVLVDRSSNQIKTNNVTNDLTQEVKIQKVHNK